MNDNQRRQISDYLLEANLIQSDISCSRWFRKVGEFFKQSLGSDAATLFEKLVDLNSFDELALKVGHLQGLLAKDDGNVTAHARNSPGQGPQEEFSTTSN